MKRNQRVKERIDDGNRIETSSLRPPTRENLRDNASQSGNENSRNARSRRARGVDDGIPPRRPSSPFSKEGENDHVSGKDEQLGYIFIDDKSQEDNQENVSAAQLQQEQYPGAVVVQGPRLGSVERGSIASGTIVVGEDNQNQRSSSIPSRNPIPNVIVAAEVAPTEEEIIARMDEMERRVREHTRQTESTMERRVREQVQQVLQQTPRAEILHLDSDRDRTPASMEEGNDIRTDIKDEVPNKNVQTLTPNGRAVSSEGSQDNLCRRRLICLIGAFTLVIAIAITVAIILTRDDNKSCSVDSDCSFNHAEGDCLDGSCVIRSCLPGYGLCDGDYSTGCEVNLLTNENHCGSCNTKCNTNNSCMNGICVLQSIQRDALMSLYDSTDGPNWYTDAQENWGSSSVHECLWHGVQCINGKVTELAKGVENLDGTLPTELGLLTGLTYLYFWSNKLSGTIPSALAQLTKLTLLTLSGNELVGGIPTEFGRLTNMRGFYVDDNQLTGQFPSEIAKMTELTWMHIENNDFTSIPPEVCSKSYSRFSGDCPPCYLGCCTACE